MSISGSDLLVKLHISTYASIALGHGKAWMFGGPAMIYGMRTVCCIILGFMFFKLD